MLAFGTLSEEVRLTSMASPFSSFRFFAVDVGLEGRDSTSCEERLRGLLGGEGVRGMAKCSAP